MLEALLQAIQSFFNLTTILLCGFGSILGFIIGAIPGIGPAIGIALVLPFSLVFTPGAALVLFISIYAGCEFGGCVSAILINVPGTGAAAATVLDGFPMAKKGKAITAISISTTSSAFGGILSTIVLICILPFLGRFILVFGTPEFFLLGILGIACIAAVSKEEMIKGLICGCFGLMICSVGIAPGTAQMRYTFGSVHLFDGFGFLPAIIGLFGVGEMLKLMQSDDTGISEAVVLSGSRLEGIVLTFKYLKTLIKSTFIGLFIGLVPGVGGTTASFVSWAEAKRSSKKPEEFGHGAPDGIVATESSNNSVVGGALMPTLLFGIPGSGAAALILGGLLMHGLRPGSDMFRGEGLVMTEMVLFSIIMSSLFLFFACLWIAPYLGKITTIRKELLVPAVFLLASLGVYIIEHSMFQVILTLFFGLLGFFLSKTKFPLFPLILALILGNMIEMNLHRSLLLGGGNLLFLLSRPICVVIVIAIFFLLLFPYVSAWRKSRKNKP